MEEPTWDSQVVPYRDERDGYKAELERLKRRVSHLERFLSHPIPPVRFSLENYAHHKRHSLKWYSPAFYAHPLSYRFCMEVNANGAGFAECTHISLFLHILPGPFDPDLKWPFRGSVAVQLLNARRDGGHHERVIRFTDETPLINSQPAEGEMAAGWGEPLFIPHSLLVYTPATGCEYLAFDRLRFCVLSVTVDL